MKSKMKPSSLTFITNHLPLQCVAHFTSGIEIRDVQVGGDAGGEETSGGEGEGAACVDHGGDGAAVQYAEAVGVVFLDRELECYLSGLEGRMGGVVVVVGRWDGGNTFPGMAEVMTIWLCLVRGT